MQMPKNIVDDGKVVVKKFCARERISGELQKLSKCGDFITWHCSSVQDEETVAPGKTCEDGFGFCYVLGFPHGKVLSSGKRNAHTLTESKV